MKEAEYHLKINERRSRRVLSAEADNTLPEAILYLYGESMR